MALWEYKIIGSGKGGFGSPTLLESHLNQLGKDEWEIIAFTSHPETPLAFQGLARRTTQRDWTLQDAAAAAAKAEAEKLRAEFAAKFQAAQTNAAAGPDEKPSSLVGDAASPEDGFRRLRDTDRDQDPEALADAEDGDEFPRDSEDELPTFFDFIKPHMRRNQRGPGLSLAVDYLSNKIDQSPADVVSALRECGFVLPEREDDDPVYIEYDGDLFWVNTNRHHQLFINTKEKPRAVFRAVKGQAVAAPEKPERQERPERQEKQEERPSKPEPRPRRQEDAPVAAAEEKPKPDEKYIEPAAGERSPDGNRGERSDRGERNDRSDRPERNDRQERSERNDRTERPAAQSAPSTGNAVPLPGGEALLARLRPMMRRNRRGPGVSGSVGFLSRALKQSEAELAAAFVAAGFPVPERPNDKPAFVDVGSWTYWINKDNRGGLWINGREKRDRDSRDRDDRGAQGESSVPASEAAPMPAGSDVSEAENGSAGSENGGEVGGQPTPPLDSTEAVSSSTVSSEASPSSSADLPATSSIPGVESTPDEPPASSFEATPSPSAPVPVDDASEAGDTDSPASFVPASGPLAPVRLLLKAKPRGVGAAGEIATLARALNRSPDSLLQLLTEAGLSLPPEGGEKSDSIVWGVETLWISKSAKDGALWLNAKAAKAVRKPRSAGGPRRPSKKTAKPGEGAGE